MNQEYAIERNGECVGKACFQRQGMYYLIRCRCVPCQKEKVRIFLRIGREERDLGLCVPIDGEMGMDTRIPVKAFSSGSVSFRLCDPEERPKEIFIPVTEHDAFGALERLMDARFALRSGIPGVLLKEDQKEISSPTGQWSEPST